jgi:hypothetical protein
MRPMVGGPNVRTGTKGRLCELSVRFLKAPYASCLVDFHLRLLQTWELFCTVMEMLSFPGEQLMYYKKTENPV